MAGQLAELLAATAPEPDKKVTRRAQRQAETSSAYAMTAATNPANMPHPDTPSKGPVEFNGALINPANSVVLHRHRCSWWRHVRHWCRLGWSGSLCIGLDTGGSTFKLYINTNTKLSPTWTVVGAQT